LHPKTIEHRILLGEEKILPSNYFSEQFSCNTAFCDNPRFCHYPNVSVSVNEFFVNYRASTLGRVAGVSRVLVIGEFFVIDRENTKMSQNVGRLRKASSIKKLSNTESRSNKINFF